MGHGMKSIVSLCLDYADGVKEPMEHVRMCRGMQKLAEQRKEERAEDDIISHRELE